MDPGAIVRGVLAHHRVAPFVAVLDVYGHAAGGLLANGLAFSALFAIIPIALVTLGLAGSFVGDPRIQGALAAALIDAFPPLESLIGGVLDALATGAVATSLVGLVGLIWTVSQFYVTLDVAFARIFAAEAGRDPLRRTLRGFVWVASLLGLVVLVIVVSAFVAAAQVLAPHVVVDAVLADLLLAPWTMLAAAILVVGIAYRVLPPQSPRWRAIAPPAVVVGIAIFGLTQLFVSLAPRLVGVAAVAGSLAAAFIALAWLSFTFQALLLGAAWVRVREGRPAVAAASALVGPAAPAEPGGGGE